MPARQEYPRHVFMALYDAIAARLAQEEPPIHIKKPNGHQDTIALGKGWSRTADKKEHNAASAIYRRLLEENIIREKDNLNFGNLLYTKYLELENNPGKKGVMVQGEAYNIGLLRYVGCDTLEQFMQDRGLRLQTESTHAAPDNTPYTHYIGLYYSFRSYRVNKFVLAIQYTDTPTRPMRCWEWGLHTKDPAPDDDKIPERVNSVHFTGEAKVSGHHLYINLNAEASQELGHPAMEMRLIGVCDEQGGRDLSDQDAIPCAVQTVSLNQYIISAEAIMVKCTPEEADSIRTNPNAYYQNRLDFGVLRKKPDLEKNVQLYLMLQRRNFRVKYRQNPSELESLEYRNVLVSRFTKRLTGEYRIWNFGLRRGYVIQSRLVIKAEIPFQAHFYPYLTDTFKHNNPGLDQQLADLVISNEIRPNQLCFATFIRQKMALVNYAIFDIDALSDDNWVEGMFITTGYDAKGLIGGYAVMCKIKPGQDCTPRRMNREEAEAYAREHGITAMHNGLRDLWKRKLWKKKSNTEINSYGLIEHPQNAGEVLLVRRTEGPYKDLFDLPGGVIQHGETPEEAMKRSVKEETGVTVGDCALFMNVTDTPEWKRKDQVEESLHLFGAVYRADKKGVQSGPMKKAAAWVRYGDYSDDAFSPFAHRALDTLMP